MKSLQVKTANATYSIMIGSGLMAKIGDLLPDSYMPGAKAAIVTDSNVAPLYADMVAKNLRDSGYLPVTIVIPAGETSKSLAQLSEIYDRLIDAGITRSDFIVALGGGVTGDISGYAAATFLRGVKFVQVPTTLLAQVDSSVGGKVAVNHPQGKNLIGAFNQPDAVISDIDTLATLPPKIFSDGMAEVIKYGFIRDAGLIEMLENADGPSDIKRSLDEIIYRCCAIKAEIVERDEFDTGERMLLNFGHTLGHAVENASGYGRYSHGEAVAIGMYNITLRSEGAGITRPGTAERVRALLEKYGLPWKNETVNVRQLSDALGKDKKKAGSGITLVLLEETGKAFLRKFEADEALKYLV